MENDGNIKDVSYPLLKMLPWFGVIVVVVAGATFGFTKYASENRIAALEHEISVRDSTIQQLKTPAGAPDISPPVPQATFDASPNKEETRSLLTKINGLESEKRALVNELVKNAKDALDPKSELFPLVAQLGSSSEEERVKALNGLFALRDPRSIPFLVTYYGQHTKEATRSINTATWQWFNLLLDLDKQAGVTFMLDVFAGSDQYDSELAFRCLRQYELDAKQVATVSDGLREIALKNKDPLARTRAKLLLQHYQERNKPGLQQEED